MRKIACVLIAGFFVLCTFSTSVNAIYEGDFRPVVYTSHVPIHITNNGQFVVGTNGVVSGGGTQPDPFIIEGWDISASSDHGIWIENTNVYFTIKNSYIHGGKVGSKDGIRFIGVSNGKIQDCNITGNNYGVYLSSVSGCVVVHNDFIDNAIQASDDGMNTWDNGYPEGGNYWSDIKGTLNITATIKTNLGDMTFKLRPDKAPITSYNFVHYAEAKFFDDLLFHRVVDNFVIQGGGLYRSGGSLTDKTPIYPPIVLETSPDLKHTDGAVSMARTSDPNSATCQFFICDGPQSSLDSKYAVFGYVYEGIDIMRTIAALPNHTEGMYQNVPDTDVIISNVTLVNVTDKDDFSGAGQDVPGSDGIVDLPYNIAGGSAKDKYPLVNPVTGPPPVPEITLLTILPSLVLITVIIVILRVRNKSKQQS